MPDNQGHRDVTLPSVNADPRLGVLAFGDSITNGGGELQWGVPLQSWAQWTARALVYPQFTEVPAAASPSTTPNDTPPA